MKLLTFLAVFLSFSLSAKTIRGEIHSQVQIKGTLYIFAKKFNSSMRMPIAVKRIDSPKFPYKFSLGEADKMIKEMPFEGPFTVVARLSPSGDAMDKSGVEVSSSKAINIGDTDIKLVLPKK